MCSRAGQARRLKANLMKFRPLLDRVVIRRLEGEVVAVGPGARDERGQIVALELKVGDRVLFGKWSGVEVKIDGQDLLIMKESDVMGVVEGASAAKKIAA